MASNTATLLRALTTADATTDTLGLCDSAADELDSLRDRVAVLDRMEEWRQAFGNGADAVLEVCNEHIENRHKVADLERKLAVAVEEIKAWRAAEDVPETACASSYLGAAIAVAKARAATDAAGVEVVKVEFPQGEECYVVTFEEVKHEAG